MALVKAYLSNCYNNRRENSYFVRVIGEKETTTYEFYDGSQLTVDEDETLADAFANWFDDQINSTETMNALGKKLSDQDYQVILNQSGINY